MLKTIAVNIFQFTVTIALLLSPVAFTLFMLFVA